MGIAQAIALNWRAITAFVMAGVQLATATKLLPVGSEEVANTLIVSAGAVIGVIAGGSYMQNIAQAHQATAAASAVSEAAKTVQEVAKVEPSPALVGGAALAARAADRLQDISRVPR